MRVAYRGVLSLMRLFLPSFTSVTRWLLVVVGCAVLETAQPMSAASAETPASREPGTLIYPQGSPDRPTQPAASGKGSGQSWTLLAAALLLAGAGVWVVLKRRGPAGLLPTRADRKIVIEESRSLGNRQYLVVAGYEDRKFLIGVTPGQIQLLARLDASQEDL